VPVASVEPIEPAESLTTSYMHSMVR